MGPSHEFNQDSSSFGVQGRLPFIQEPYGAPPSTTETHHLLGVDVPVNISSSLGTQPQRNVFSPAFVRPSTISTREPALDYLFGYSPVAPMIRQSFVGSPRSLAQFTETSNSALPHAGPTTMDTEDTVDRTIPREQRTKRRGKYDDQKREKIKHVRNRGACTRCRMYKETVRLYPKVNLLQKNS